MTDILETITTWAADITWNSLPPGVRQRARLAFTDTVGTMVGGASTDAASIALDYSATAAGPSALVLRGQGATPANAAFGNAVAASALDFDDGHYLAGAIHPGAVIVPAVLAVAGGGTTVSEALLATVVGYEVGLRAAAQLWALHPGDHYHATGCAGAIGAAAGAAKLLGLDADGIARAIKIGWVHAPMSTFGMPHVKESIGWGASTGVAAAQLAAAGWMKSPVGYDPEPNDIILVSPFHDRGGPDDPFITSIGATYEILNTYFKTMAACRYIHAAGAGFLCLMQEHGIEAADIEAVRIGTHGYATMLDDAAPQTIEAAQYSFPTVMASLALWGAVGAREMDVARLGDAERLGFAKLVTVEHDADLDQHYPARYPSRVAITTATGTVSGLFLDAPFDPETPYGEGQLMAKWDLLYADALGAGKAEQVLAGLADQSAVLSDVLAPVWAVQ